LDTLRYAEVLLRQPGVITTLLLSLLLALGLARPVARSARLSVLGTGLTIFGLGLAVAVTLVNRLRVLDLVWSPNALRPCLDPFSANWFAPEALLNLTLLTILGFGAFVASWRILASALLVVATGLGLESLQAVTGLGTCESGDAIRNLIGGFAAIAAACILLRFLGQKTPQIMRRPGPLNRPTDQSHR
jgi:glycopeptide antibiotics resistance protein